MNDQSQAQTDLELQVVELGDAKELTQGFQAVVYAEDNPAIPGRF